MPLTTTTLKPLLNPPLLEAKFLVWSTHQTTSPDSLLEGLKWNLIFTILLKLYLSGRVWGDSKSCIEWRLGFILLLCLKHGCYYPHNALWASWCLKQAGSPLGWPWSLCPSLLFQLQMLQAEIDAQGCSLSPLSLEYLIYLQGFNC